MSQMSATDMERFSSDRIESKVVYKPKGKAKGKAKGSGWRRHSVRLTMEDGTVWTHNLRLGSWHRTRPGKPDKTWSNTYNLTEEYKNSPMFIGSLRFAVDQALKAEDAKQAA